MAVAVAGRRRAGPFSFNPPVVVDDTIYFGSDDGNFYALDVHSGYMRWIFKSLAPVNSVPFADQDHLYFGSNDGHVYAVARDTGEERWRFPTEYTVQSLILRYGDLVMFTSDRGNTHFVTADTGREVHYIPNPVWSYHTFQVYDGVMYWAPGPPGTGASFGAYDVYEQGYLWVKRTTPGLNWYSFPALRGDELFYSAAGPGRTMTGNLLFVYYAVDRLTGEELWRMEEESFFGDAGERLYQPYRVFVDSLRLLDYLAPALWRNTVIYTSGDAGGARLQLPQRARGVAPHLPVPHQQRADGGRRPGLLRRARRRRARRAPAAAGGAIRPKRQTAVGDGPGRRRAERPGGGRQAPDLWHRPELLLRHGRGVLRSGTVQLLRRRGVPAQHPDCAASGCRWEDDTDGVRMYR